MYKKILSKIYFKKLVKNCLQNTVLFSIIHLLFPSYYHFVYNSIQNDCKYKIEGGNIALVY